MLKIGHRICINQEIASLLYKLDYPKSEINAISPELEQRVKEIERLIYKYDFQSINEFPFLIEEYENN
ncbi:hypothetical protein [Flavobacterium sp.]|uniref:hypothetical protein n=1 Tax=Flavobacterium sp. TaxID=239 RepID=UPI002612885F|nr:hypothetical protein [Flavobacterium sp.]